MKLLSLSTSTPRGSAALFDVDLDGPAEAAAPALAQGSGALAAARPAGAQGAGARLLAATTYADLHGHAERIFGAVDEVLAAAGLPAAAIGALGCDIGPGSFTGVRVAVAAAKGVALALDVPVAGVTSLEAMAAAAFAEGAASPGDLLVPVIDAKKGEVFLAAYDGPAAPPRLSPQHLPRDAAHDAVAAVAAGRRVVVVGAIAGEIEALRPLAAQGEALDLPGAIWIGRVAIDRLRAAAARGERGRPGGELDPELLEPLYVRAPDAKPAELGYTPPR
ncbi:tRNA (adenosine(37)-N6)-threonylcarbamoyltransferase complex dimerization subunit type 1 TsaB [Sorangium sp. So ce1036]|uniref:tRNA (adenosine(37)-N6)-threonylcarbamoyltransferase complex dimerization subunit type 1 TsaB n=1 Tax=Sorangium sp. So ce1036 TaxID=3133328 RepID=UPI003F0AFB40